MLQGMHINKIEELKEASDMVSGAIKATRASLPQRLYWKETTPQHYLTGTGAHPPFSDPRRANFLVRWWE